MQRTMRLRQKMRYAGVTSAGMAEALGRSERYVKERVKRPEALLGGELAELVELLGMTPADLWTVVTGKTLKVKDLQDMEI